MGSNDVVITCANGTGARLLELEQHSTYRGLLDGGPTHELNQSLLREIVDRTGRIPTHLVRPTERPLEEGKGVEPYVFLPDRQCTGLFDCGGHWLTIVWFQDSWAPPIEVAILEHLRSIDFMALAFDEMGTW
jgi:hypothetical protein